jgi:hypothetical protein
MVAIDRARCDRARVHLIGGSEMANVFNGTQWIKCPHCDWYFKPGVGTDLAECRCGWLMYPEDVKGEDQG